MPHETDQTTDTHLAKKYNDALFDCMMRCNMTSYVNKSTPHIKNLIAYFSATENFLTNTFFLFEQVTIQTKNQDVPLSQKLIDLNNQIDLDIRNLKTYKHLQTKKNFHDIDIKISYMHKLIMYGLQRRQMLVRTSDREPRGSESIKYWDEKVGFREGGLNMNPQPTK